MTLNQLIKELCKREGKKSQVYVGNMREVLANLQDMIAEDIFSEGGETVSGEMGTLGALFAGVQKRLDTRWKKFNKSAK